MQLSITASDIFFIAVFLALAVAAGLVKAHFGFAIALAAAFWAGAFAAIVDAHNNEVQSAVIVIVAGTFLLGLAHPAHVWLWALGVGLAIPVAGLAHRNWGTLVALIPAFIGAYAGASIRHYSGIYPQ